MAKRADLVLGQEYATVAPSHQVFNGYGWRVTKVKVKSLEPYRQISWGGAMAKTNKGNGVLVSVTTSRLGETYTTDKIVQLSHFWMPWDEYEVKQEQAKKEREEYRVQQDIRMRQKAEQYRDEWLPAFRELNNAVKAATGKTLYEDSRMNQDRKSVV